MESGQSYHIYNHANGSENIFREEDNYRYFLQQYEKYLGGVVDTYAYCLMPNHFHFLVGVKSDLSGFQNLTGLIKHPSKNPAIKAFSDFFNSYTKAYNLKYDRKGSLFMRAFQRQPILNESQWQQTFLYIHLNPIKHGFSKDYRVWKYSSWQSYQRREFPSKLNRVYYLNYFDSLEQVESSMEIKKEWLINKNLE